MVFSQPLEQHSSPWTPLSPRICHFQFLCGKRTKWWNCTSNHEYDGRYWIGNPKLLFTFHSNNMSISLSFGDICVWQTDREIDSSIDHYYNWPPHCGRPANKEFEKSYSSSILRTQITVSNRIRKSNICSGQWSTDEVATKNRPCRQIWAYKASLLTYTNHITNWIIPCEMGKGLPGDHLQISRKFDRL